MFLPGERVYSDGMYAPELAAAFGVSGWKVWCKTGVQEVLRQKEYLEFLAEKPGRIFQIGFADGAAVSINPGESLWQLLAEIANDFIVEVFPLTMNKPRYVRWTGALGDLETFDAIQISAKLSNSR